MNLNEIGICEHSKVLKYSKILRDHKLQGRRYVPGNASLQCFPPEKCRLRFEIELLLDAFPVTLFLSQLSIDIDRPHCCLSMASVSSFSLSFPKRVERWVSDRYQQRCRTRLMSHAKSSGDYVELRSD